MSASRPTGNIACLLVTHLPVKAERQRRPALNGKPLVIVTRQESGDMVLDSAREARGVAAGMSLPEVLARCRNAVVLQADDPFYEDCFAGMENVLATRCPVVERDEMGRLYADLEGMPPAYGGEARLIASLLQAAPPQFKPRLGLASTRFIAYAVASVATPGGAARAPVDGAAFLSRFPIDLLPISPEGKAGLHAWGVHTLGHLAYLPLGAVVARLGEEGRCAWELAQGMEPGPMRDISRRAA